MAVEDGMEKNRTSVPQVSIEAFEKNEFGESLKPNWESGRVEVVKDTLMDALKPYMLFADKDEVLGGLAKDLNKAYSTRNFNAGSLKGMDIGRLDLKEGGKYNEADLYRGAAFSEELQNVITQMKEGLRELAKEIQDPKSPFAETQYFMGISKLASSLPVAQALGLNTVYFEDEDGKMVPPDVRNAPNRPEVEPSLGVITRAELLKKYGSA